MKSDNPLAWNIEDNTPDKKLLEESAKNQHDIDVQFNKAFSTPAGKEVLSWLVLYTLDSPTWWPGKPTDFGFYREGQNHLVRQIKDKIKRAKDYMEKKK